MFHHSLGGKHAVLHGTAQVLGLVLTKLGQSIYTTEEGFLMERVEGIYYNNRDEEVSNYLVIFMAKIDWLPSFLAGRKRLTKLI